MKGFFWTYLVIRIISLEILGIYSIHKLVDWKVLILRAFHPDEAGGAIAIGQYRLGFVYGVIGFSVFFIFPLIRTNLSPSYATMQVNFADIFLYILLISTIPFSFFASVWGVHNFMKSEKSKLIAPIAETIEIELQKLTSINNHSTDSQAIRQQMPQDLIATMEALKRTPDWPFNTGILRRLFGFWIPTVITPFIIQLIGTRWGK